MLNKNIFSIYINLFMKTGVVIFSIFIFTALFIPPPNYIKKYALLLINNSSVRIFVIGVYNNPYIFLKLYEIDIKNGNIENAEEDLNLALGICNIHCYYYNEILSLKKMNK